MDAFINPGTDISGSHPEYSRFSNLSKAELQGRWKTSRGQQILQAFLSSHSSVATIDSVVGRFNGKLDLRGVPLQGQDLSKRDFSDCDLFSADLRNASLWDADARRSYLSEADLRGTNLSWLRVADTLFDNAKFDRTTILIGINLAEINTNFALALISEARDQQRIEEINRRHPIFGKFLKVTCDYGRSLLRWSAWTLGTMLGFSLVYWRVPGLISTPSGIAPRFFDALYFSVVTFTTLGYGDVLPVSVLAKSLAMIEVSVGYLMGGLLIAILEAVINFRAGGVARENRARRGGVRRLWRVHRRGRQQRMARFSPQPFGLGPVFPISASLVARRFPIFVAPYSWN